MSVLAGLCRSPNLGIPDTVRSNWSSDLRDLTFHLLTCRLIQMETKTPHFGGNQARREHGAAFEGNTLKGKPHECQWYVIRPQGSLRSNPSRG